MLTVTDSGEMHALSAFLNKTTPNNMRLGLYVNDVDIGDTTTTVDLTEASFTGYASVIMVGPSWVITGGAPSVAAYPVVIFEVSGVTAPQTVYGYYVTNSGSGELIWGEKFPTPELVDAAGQRISVAPRLTAKDESN